jgi:hypothetical protein
MLQAECSKWSSLPLAGPAAAAAPLRRPSAGPGRAAGPGEEQRQRVQELKNFFAEARAYRDAVRAGQQVRTDTRYASMIAALNR